MITADIIVLVGCILFVLIGAMVGFGKGLKFFTSGIFGIIISAFVCYLIFGFVLNWGVVGDLLAKFNNWLTEQGNVGTFFANIHIDKIVLAVVLFIIIQIIRVIIVKIIKGIVEIDNILFKIINKILGAAFMFVVALAILLIVFQIVAWIGGDTAANFAEQLKDSVFRLDDLFANNPLNAIFKK